MGRSKTSKPKRQRIEITEASEPSPQPKDADTNAIEQLQNVPSGIVEEAAADIYRSLITHYDNLDDVFRRHPNPSESITATSRTSTPPRYRPQFDGVGRCTPPTSDFVIFQRLFDTIKKLAHSKMTSWSGDPSDPRRRAFGFLPHTLGYQDSIRKLLDISMPSTASHATPNSGVGGGTSVETERCRNERAMVILNPNSSGGSGGSSGFLEEVKDAVERLLAQLRAFVNPSSGLLKYLHYSQLIAAQPNLHSGRHLLPHHVDHPTRDGFGIIIVTIAIRGSAHIMLETNTSRSNTASKSINGSPSISPSAKKTKLSESDEALPSPSQSTQAVFTLNEGDAYMLSGVARNECVHGVLAHEGIYSGHRESLNLRFGLHGRESHDPPAEDVLKHWSF